MNRRLSSRAGKAAALSLGTGVASLVALLVSSVLSRVLPQSDYATYRQTLLVYSFISPLLVMGLPQSLYYFLPAERSRLRGRTLDALLLLLGSAAVIACLILFGGDRLLARRFGNPALMATLPLLGLYAAAMLPTSLVAPVLVIREKVGRLSLFQVVGRSLVGGGAILCALAWRTPYAAILGQSCAAAGVAVAGLVLMFHALPADSWHPNRSAMADLLRYAVPLGLATVMGTAFKQVDKVVVSSLCTPEQFAVYANGAFEIPFIAVITGSVSSIILADMRRDVVEGKATAALALFRRTAEKSAMLLLPIMFFLFIAAEECITFLFSSRYAGSVLPFRIYLLLVPVRIAFYGPLLIAIGRKNTIFYLATVSLALNAALSIVGVHAIGYLGAIVATLLVTYGFLVPANFMVIRRELNTAARDILPFWALARAFALLIPLAILAWAAGTLFPPQSHAPRLLIRLAVFWPPVLIWWHRRRTSLRKAIHRPWRSHDGG